MVICTGSMNSISFISVRFLNSAPKDMRLPVAD